MFFFRTFAFIITIMRIPMKKQLFFLFIVLLMLTSCSQSVKKYRIGVSQCSADIWRDKQNAELRMEAYFHDNVELRFAAAYGSDARQIQQIDSLINEGIDLLIVAPNQVATISPAIDRAYDRGIPVIVFERKTSSKKYTAFMAADNYEMGRLMGEYIATLLHGVGQVVEVMGLEGSSPAIDRHDGFREAMSHYPGIEVVATLQGDWTQPTSYNIMRQWLAAHPDISVDLVFGMNDRSAMGARQAFQKAGRQSLPLFCGIDGLPGEGGGIQLVRDSLLNASYIYPTRGDQLLQLAVDILDGKPYPKETRLVAALVTPDNAHVLQLESDEVMRQADYIERLNKKADNYLQQLANQRVLNFLFVGLVVLLLLLIVGVYMYYLQKIRINAERTQMERDQLDFYTRVSHELRTPLTLIEGPLAQLAETTELRQACKPTSELFQIVMRNTRQLADLISKMLDVQVGKGMKLAEQEEVYDACLSKNDEQGMVKNENLPETEERATILIVDDNADILTYLRQILQERYDVLEAADGQKGLTLAREQVPDLIISDVMMPVMNGLAFCQGVKDDVVTSHIPVILLTARALSRHQVEGYDSGADAYITKPFHPDVLLACISNLLRNRRQLKVLWGDAVSKGDISNVGKRGTDIVDCLLSSGKNVEHEERKEASLSTSDNLFIQRFRNVVEERLSDSNLSVEDVASEMNLSRVQLYRKVKAITGFTPVELIRKGRLVRARHLLETTDKTVSQVAYACGFSAPSYFTKCYKEEFGELPSK